LFLKLLLCCLVNFHALAYGLVSLVGFCNVLLLQKA
jgi:hypothetical protein